MLEAAAPPPAPTLPGSVRAAFGDFYYNSWRLVAANLVWGAGLFAVWFVFLASPPLALVTLPLLALPTVGLWRVAALAVRSEPVALSDGFAAWRAFGRPALALGVGAVAAVVVLGTNLAIGLASGSVLGWALATLAGWGLLATGIALLAAWTLLVDPWRADLPTRGRLRIAGLLVLAHPVRLGGLALVVAVLLVVSTVLFAALVTVSIAFVALVTARYLLPAADRLEARLDGIVRRADDEDE